MEYWNDGILGRKPSQPAIIETHYSTIPLFHHSIPFSAFSVLSVAKRRFL
jgi:hypothetical protein